MTQIRTIPLPYAGEFARIEADLPGGNVPWLAAMRRDAFARIAESGLPSRKTESWKYTSLQSLAETALRPADVKDATAALDAGALPAIADAYRLVFVNGHFRADLSEAGPAPAGVTVTTLAAAAAHDATAIEGRLGALARLDGHATVNVNTAFMTDGCVVGFQPGATVERPLHLVFVGTAGESNAALAYHPRNLIVAGENSRAMVVESHVGAADGRYWSNPVTEIAVEAGARVVHVKVQDDAPAATHLSFSRARVSAKGHYESFVMTLGAALSRNEIEVVLDGEEAGCHLDGAYLVRDGQHADTTTFIEHAKANCESREVYKGVLDGRAKGVFQGKIRVDRDAQKTNGHQLNRTILLSDQAEATAKPELEIYADDVKCSHGATAGELDDDSLFYMRARGIPADEARRLLVRAFVEELIERIDSAAVRTHLDGLLDGWLAGAAGEGEAK